MLMDAKDPYKYIRGELAISPVREVSVKNEQLNWKSHSESCCWTSPDGI
jgi:hypothetical protein